MACAPFPILSGTGVHWPTENIKEEMKHLQLLIGFLKEVSFESAVIYISIGAGCDSYSLTSKDICYRQSLPAFLDAQTFPLVIVAIGEQNELLSRKEFDWTKTKLQLDTGQSYYEYSSEEKGILLYPFTTRLPGMKGHEDGGYIDKIDPEYRKQCAVADSLFVDAFYDSLKGFIRRQWDNSSAVALFNFAVFRNNAPLLYELRGLTEKLGSEKQALIKKGPSYKRFGGQKGKENAVYVTPFLDGWAEYCANVDSILPFVFGRSTQWVGIIYGDLHKHPIDIRSPTAVEVEEQEGKLVFVLV